MNATQLSDVLRRLGIGASAVAEEIAMLLALLSDDDCSEAEAPTVDSVPLRRLEHLKAAECRQCRLLLRAVWALGSRLQVGALATGRQPKKNEIEK